MRSCASLCLPSCALFKSVITGPHLASVICGIAREYLRVFVRLRVSERGSKDAQGKGSRESANERKKDGARERQRKRWSRRGQQREVEFLFV